MAALLAQKKLVTNAASVTQLGSWQPGGNACAGWSGVMCDRSGNIVSLCEALHAVLPSPSKHALAHARTPSCRAMHIELSDIAMWQLRAHCARLYRTCMIITVPCQGGGEGAARRPSRLGAPLGLGLSAPRMMSVAAVLMPACTVRCELLRLCMQGADELRHGGLAGRGPLQAVQPPHPVSRRRRSRAQPLPPALLGLLPPCAVLGCAAVRTSPVPPPFPPRAGGGGGGSARCDESLCGCWQHVLVSCSEGTFASPGAPNAALTVCAAASPPRRQLGQNRLTGVIPASWTSGGLSSLTVLDVSANQLSGNLPVGLSKLSGLQTLRAGTNKFTGGLRPYRPSWNVSGFRSSDCAVRTVFQTQHRRERPACIGWAVSERARPAVVFPSRGRIVFTCLCASWPLSVQHGKL